MSTLLMMVIVLSWSAALALAWRRRLEEQLPLAVTGMITTLYAFGLAGKLVWGIHATAVLTGFAAMYALYRLCKLRKAALGLLVTPGTAMLLVVFAWLLLCFRTHTPYVWDDFSHWMLAVKNMVHLDALPSAVERAAISYRSYPPGATLFGYLWTKLSGAFNEGDPQRAQNLLILCFLLPIMRQQTWRGWGRALCMAACLFVLPLVYSQAAYSCVYVDTLMGCLALHIVATWLAAKHDRHASLSIGCALALLPLMKPTGLVFAALALAIIVVDECLQRRGRLKVLAALAAVVALSALSWQAFLKVHRVTEVWSESAFSLSALLALFGGNGEPYQQNTIANFLQYFTRSHIIANDSRMEMSLAFTAVAFAVLGMLLPLLTQDRDVRRRWRVATVSILAGLFVYLAALLFAYLFSFRPHEAEGLYSYPRYLSSYLIFMTGILVVAADAVAGRRAWKWLALCLVALVLLSDPESIRRSTVSANDQGNQLQSTLQQHKIPEQVANELDAETSRLFLIATPEDGYSFFLNAYALSPVRVQPGEHGWALEEGGPYPPDAWVDLLIRNGYTHVYSLSRNVKNDFGGRLEAPSVIRDKTLYRIEQTPQGIRLKEVQGGAPAEP